MVEEVWSSCKEVLLSICVLIHQMSYYSLNLGIDAKKCPFGEERRNFLDKIGKGLNSAPHPKLRMSQKFSSGCGNLHWGVYFMIIPVHLAGWSSALSRLGLTCQNRGKRGFTFFQRVRMFRRDSGKHPSFPVTQIRPLTFSDVVHHYLWPHKKPCWNAWESQLFPGPFLPTYCLFFNLIYQFKQRKKTKRKKPKQKPNNDLSSLLTNCLGNSVNCLKLIQQSWISIGVEYSADQYPIHPNTLPNRIFNEVSSSASPNKMFSFAALELLIRNYLSVPN